MINVALACIYKNVTIWIKMQDLKIFIIAKIFKVFIIIESFSCNNYE